MPETSQDAFETLNPGKQSTSTQELRERKSSVNSKNGKPKVRVDPLVVAETNLWPSQLSAMGKKGPRGSRVSVGELDSCHTAPEPKGYKRAISHR